MPSKSRIADVFAVMTDALQDLQAEADRAHALVNQAVEELQSLRRENESLRELIYSRWQPENLKRRPRFNIAAALKEEGLTVFDMSFLSGIPEGRMKGIIYGRLSPKPGEKAKIAGILGVEVEALFTESEAKSEKRRRE